MQTVMALQRAKGREAGVFWVAAESADLPASMSMTERLATPSRLH
jgi:hypothetical protein